MFTFAALRQRGEAALVPFLMAGDPDLGMTLQLAHAAEQNGADLLELGVAFSDPTADGCTDPGWSPDGAKIVFAKGQHTDIDGNIYTVNVDGTGLTQVTHTGGSQSPDWGVHPLAP